MPAEIDIFQYVIFAVLALLIFFMFRNSRKNKQRQEELKKEIVPGADVMTNFGLFGTLISVDEVSNVAELEVSPGNIVRVHRQTIAKVVTTDGESDSDEPRSVEEAMERANREYEAKEAADVAATEPEFGERVETVEAADVDTTVVPEKKTARRPSKKASE
ncbi:preprotein translocase subunit YajC [Glaciihabitans arcticus]|uniref:Preprotein translocase subunit YajC n=1 Tax=Glaciihabitans arcticus TaxID=2668039 RepID=A0A4Q9GRQ6_9MICO|nr:preprotein translocase subunit YajC [Glaciihabitans arcticus]TBN56784.1 preprotein translocase subunit YajC [Glaciihabitans arcticus]